MNERERLLSAVNGRPADRAPFICPGGMMTMVVVDMMEESGYSWPDAHVDSETMARLTLAAHELGGVENVGVPFCMTIEAEGMGAKVELGAKDSEPRVTEYAIERFAQIDRVGLMNPREGRAAVCLDAIGRLKDIAPHVPVIANLTGPVSLATSLIEPLLYYRAIRKDKEAAHAITDIATESIKFFGRAMLEAGADLVCIADPSATGEIIGRPAFEEFALPYINRLIDDFKAEYSAPSIVHICGDVKSLGTSLADLASEVVSVDSMVSLASLKGQVKGKVTMGNVSTIMLERGERDQVFKAGASRLRGGVDILAPACGISPRTLIENIRAMSRAAAGEAVSDQLKTISN